jgi:hypothetical protein
MSASLVTVPSAALEKSATAVDIRAQVNLIQEVMHAVMKDGTHFGTIPGTDKPTLFKAGAEKILMTFRIAAQASTIDDLSTPDEIRYRVTVRGVSQGTGVTLGEGVGECSSNEEKYRWRRPVHTNEYAAAPADRRREKWTRAGDTWQQVRTEPADVANTILKMAHKRALVAMTLVVTAASDVFTQDIEDVPEELRDAAAETKPKPKMQAPQRKATAKTAQAAGTTVTGTVTEVSRGRNGMKGDTPWQIWKIKLSDQKVYSTFSESQKQVADDAQRTGAPVTVTYKDGQYGRDLLTIAIIDAADVEDNTPIPDEIPEPGSDG